MSTSEHAFEQVRSILGKLDRSIDEARQRRLEPGSPAPVREAAPVRETDPERPFGRAKPIPRQDRSSFGNWPQG